jgi:hypothetical protein
MAPVPGRTLGCPARRYQQVAMLGRKATGALNLLPLAVAQRTWPDLLPLRPDRE